MSLKSLFFNALEKYSEIDDTMQKKTISKNIIGFYGCDGNTGTTSLLAHVAKELHTPNTPVVIVDLNVGHPKIYRYFVDEIEEERSIIAKLRNGSLPVTELISLDSINVVAIVSATGGEVPNEYATAEKMTVSNILNELASKYSYVLVDLGSNLNDDLTCYGIVNCNRVYSCVRPVEDQVSRLILIHEMYENYGKRNLIYNVIQCQCMNTPYSPAQFEENGLRLFGNIDFNYELMMSADACKFNNGSLKNKSVKAFLNIVSALSEDIKNFVQKSINIKSEKDIKIADGEDLSEFKGGD